MKSIYVAVFLACMVVRRFIGQISVALLSLWLTSAYAADSARPGEYVLSGDSGRLKVEQVDGNTVFAISTVGGNCHTCDLSGQVIGTTAKTVEEGASAEESACQIRMTPSTDGKQVTVVPLTEEPCRQYCGMRAGFDGVYRQPQPMCTRLAQRKSRETFIGNYRAKKFEQAVAVLRPMLEQCSEFLGWIEIDRVRNDLALAYFHSGNTQQCVETLRQTNAFSYADEEALRHGLPPCDFDNYISTAQATWHNMRLCGAQTEPRKMR